ncbi:MAG: DUF2029 domain-containing protein [Proteobacteria bacterium]|nr:DUF2029 domain-containing protein [Pseudomonadota bacterium]
MVFANVLVVLILLAQWLHAAVTGDLSFRGHAIGLDFVNTWLGAKLTLAGDVSPLFDFNAYNRLLKELFNAHFPNHMWSYPPHLLPLVAPLGALPYPLAYAIWCFATWLTFLLGSRALGFRDMDLLLLATSPAICMNIIAGQTGALAAGCLMLALAYSARRPIIAGIAVAVLTVKPQFGLIIPIEWLLRRRFLAIAIGVAATLALVGLSLAILGASAWQGFFDVTMPSMRTVMLSGQPAAAKVMQPNWASSLRLLGLPYRPAIALQTIFSLILIGWWLRLAWKMQSTHPDEGRIRHALLLMASVLATPYIHNYDLVLVAPVVIWAWRDPAVLDLPPRWRRLLLILVWLLPWIIIPLHEVRIILGPILLTALTVLLMRQAERGMKKGESKIV